MIPTLLWQCPICRAEETLTHRLRCFRPDEVRCSFCGTVWELSGFTEEDYCLKVVRGESTILGCERPLAEWYALMKASVQLTPKHDSSLDLQAGEELYLQSQKVKLFVEEENSLLQSWDQEDAPHAKSGELGFPIMKAWDRGRLLLTNQRFLWVGRHGRLGFWHQRVNSVHTEAAYRFVLLYGLCRYRFQLHKESVLKWLTYSALVARRVEQTYHHQIVLSNY